MKRLQGRHWRCWSTRTGPRGSTGPRGVQGAKGLRGVAGIQGPLGVQGPVGSTGEVYWLIIYRFDWRLGMVKKCALLSTMYQRIG